MDEIKYHPLINDGSSPDMVPMFFTTDESAVSTKFYLTEFVSHYYRFCSKDAVSNDDAAEYQIHCPYCGKVMKAISSPTDTHKQSLYTCCDCGGKTHLQEDF